MNWKVLIHSIIAAAIGGASSAILAVYSSPNSFNFTKLGLENLARVALGGAVVAVLALLKQSPVNNGK